ncbi:MAG: hypothetical protein ACR2PR_09185 [Pseudohongiellaceae bacterium]
MPQIPKPIPETEPPQSIQECREFMQRMDGKTPVGIMALADPRWRLLNLYPIRDVVSGKYKTLRELGGVPQYGWDIFHALYPSYGMGMAVINQLIDKETGEICPITLRIIIAKARQVGITMWAVLLMIDAMLFAGRQFRGGICNYTEEECQKTIEEKLHGVRDNSPWLQHAGVHNASKDCLALMQGTRRYGFIEVMQSPRGQNPDFGLITEYAKVSARDMEKAKEQRESWFAAGEHKPLIIESTSFGPTGDYYKICNRARQQQINGFGLDRKSFDLHFIGWHSKPQNVVENSVHELRPIYEEHFDEVEKDSDTTLTTEQKNWWISTLINDFQGDIIRMRHEHPGTYADFFSADNDAFVMSEQMRLMKSEERIINLPTKEHGCIVSFDLGKNDHTAYIAAQLDSSGFIHIIDAYKEKNVDISHFIERIRQQSYTVSQFVLPFDAGIKNEVARFLTGQRDIAVETFFRTIGIHNIKKIGKMRPMEGIVLSRRFSAHVKINAKLVPLISDLTSVRKELDKASKTYLMQLPRSAPENHLYSAFQHLAQAYQESPGIFEGSGGKWAFSDSGKAEEDGMTVGEGSAIITEA